MERAETAVARLFDDWADQGRGDRMETGHLPTSGQSLARLPFDATRPQAFLDLGCGNGYAVRWAAQCLHPRGRAIGVDISRRMLHESRRSTTDSRCAYLRAAYDHLPLGDATVDLGFSHEAIYYVPDVDLALREVARVLRPTAPFHVSLDYYAENKDSHHWPAQLGLRLTLDSAPGWARRLERAGFRDVTHERLHTPLPLGGQPLDADANTSPAGTLLLTARRGTP